MDVWTIPLLKFVLKFIYLAIIFLTSKGYYKIDSMHFIIDGMIGSRNMLNLDMIWSLFHQQED